MKILITGGAGYLGSVMTEHFLRRGHSVTVLDNLLYHQRSLLGFCHQADFEFLFGDARDERLLKAALVGQDVIIPLAALVGAPACDRDPWLSRSVNFEAIALLNRLRDPGQLIIYPNTNSGYGTKSGESFCTETSPLDPISLYGIHKVEAERELLNSPNVVVFRLATVFGTSYRMRLDLLVNDFVYAAVRQSSLVLFEKDFKRNYVHIRDVAEAFEFALDRPEMLGRVFNLGLDEANLSKAELAELIKKFVPKLAIHESAIGEDPDKRNYIVSNQRLKEAGFTAKRSLEQGVLELIKGFRLLNREEFRNV